MPQPDFIGLGAQRCGTTSIYKALSAHPDTCFPKGGKEVHFFDRYYDRGSEWYRSLFDHCFERFSGEITPDYLYNKKYAKRISDFHSDQKYFVSLRNPVDRAYSQYKHVIMKKYYGKGFRSFLRDYPDAIQRGFYARQLTRYFHFVPPSNIKIIIFDDFLSKRQETLEELRDFLGLESVSGWPPEEDPKGSSQVPDYHLLYAFGKRITRLLHDLNLSSMVTKIKKTGIKKILLGESKEGDFPPMPADLRKELRDKFRDDVVKLSQMLDRDLEKEWFQDDE